MLPVTAFKTLNDTGLGTKVIAVGVGGVVTGIVSVTGNEPFVPGAPSTVTMHEPVTPRAPSVTLMTLPTIAAVTGMLSRPPLQTIGLVGASTNGPLYPDCEIVDDCVEPSRLVSPKLIWFGVKTSGPTAAVDGDADGELVGDADALGDDEAPGLALAEPEGDDAGAGEVVGPDDAVPIGVAPPG